MSEDREVECCAHCRFYRPAMTVKSWASKRLVKVPQSPPWGGCQLNNPRKVGLDLLQWPAVDAEHSCPSFDSRRFPMQPSLFAPLPRRAHDTGGKG